MNPPRTPEQDSADLRRREQLSALADGESAGQADLAAEACALWRDDAQSRATWHSYQLIGDVLRSEDLASSPARDAAFLNALRSRLALEPVVLAPEPLAVAPRAAAAAVPARTARGFGWRLPAAMAAGFVAVAGVVVVARLSSSGAEAPLLAVGTPGGSALQLTSTRGAEDRPPATYVVEGRLIRDARLDAYLRAHRGAMGGVPAALPGAAPRSIETLSPVSTAAAAPASAVR